MCRSPGNSFSSGVRSVYRRFCGLSRVACRGGPILAGCDSLRAVRAVKWDMFSVGADGHPENRFPLYRYGLSGSARGWLSF